MGRKRSGKRQYFYLCSACLIILTEILRRVIIGLNPFLEQAKIMIGILNVIEKAKQVDIEMEKKRKEMTRRQWQH